MSSSHPVIVVGAGAAGLACALSAAQQGKHVLLLEKSAQLGGTVQQALIHTIGGLFDAQGELLNTGLPEQLIDKLQQASSYTKKRRIGKTWVLDVDPAVYTQVVTDWIDTTGNIKVQYQAEVSDIVVQSGQVKQITISNQPYRPEALIDTTGHAEIVQQIDTQLVDAGEALSGLIVQLRGIEPNALQFPKGVAILREIRKAAEQQQLPAECATVWLDTGIYPDEIYAKFNLMATDYDPARAQTIATQLVDFLKPLQGFENVFIKTIGQLGIRDGGRIQGEYCLTETDLKAGQRFDDAACRASWPIEHWHPEQGIRLEYLETDYDIPLRCFKVKGFTNLWAIGKCLSAEPRAQASARVVGTCWAMGEAVGQQQLTINN